MINKLLKRSSSDEWTRPSLTMFSNFSNDLSGVPDLVSADDAEFVAELAIETISEEEQLL